MTKTRFIAASLWNGASQKSTCREGRTLKESHAAFNARLPRRQGKRCAAAEAEATTAAHAIGSSA
jgi:hypothetical protein